MAVPSAHERSTSAGLPSADAICPYLLSADRAWRSAEPSRDLRCTAVEPPALLTPEKQRRLCLVAEHGACATFQAASGAGELGAVASGRHRPRVVGPSGRPIVRTAPVVLDHARLAMAAPNITVSRSVAQAGLIGLMTLAFAIILIARLSVGGGSPDRPDSVGGAGAAATPSPVVSPSTPAVAAVPSASSDHTLVPSDVEPSEAPSQAAASAPPEATPEPPAATPEPKTYKVKRGDTLSGIAAEYGTTAKKLMKLNGIKDPTKLRVGQVIDLP